MAYKVKNYGNGELGDVSDVTATINSYARVTAVDSASVTVNTTTQVDGAAVFKAGAKVLLHVSATTGEKTYLGKYLLTEITAIDNGVLTLADDPTTIMPTDQLSKYYMQAIAVAQYRNLTIATGTNISPPAYSVTSYHGGIVAIMCSESLVFNGGNISLTDRGIPTSSTALRPKFEQELDGTDDIEPHSAWENDCSRKFPLNCGDGAAFIVAKSMTFNENSRIGNVATYGVQFYRGATNSVTYNETPPNNVTNVGGSSIFIAAETVKDFSPRMIAKYRFKTSPAGQGLCRCYIASETKLRNDEGLYSYDVASKPSRIRAMNIKNFGNGSFGDLNNVTTQLNNYAAITAINGNQVTYTGKTTEGLAQIGAGALVMIHFNNKDDVTVEHTGKFILANVVSDDGEVLTLDATPPDISVTDYVAQVISMPQCNNFTLSTLHNAIYAFDGKKGGIFAVAAKNSCDLTNGRINIYGNSRRTHPNISGYGRNGLATIGNAQDGNKLPIGGESGSVFILAQNLTMNPNTRIGFVNSRGKTIANGYFHSPDKKYYGGYRGVSHYSHYLAYNGSWELCLNTNYTGTGSGADGGTSASSLYKGGYGGFGTVADPTQSNVPNQSPQGAHVMIIADTITNFTLDAICTGGYGCNGSGGAGYGGAGDGGTGLRADYSTSTITTVDGGYNGGGCSSGLNNYAYARFSNGAAGSSGWAFVYCNHAVNQDTEGITYDD